MPTLQLAAHSGFEVRMAIALRLKALADPVRVKLVSLLFCAEAGEVCSCDLAAAVELTESTVSHHLSQLRRAGLVESEHPLGASGARIMTTLVNALEQRGGRYGLQTMCEGGGMANATIIERLS